MSLSANRFFYTNTNHNDASNVLINYDNLTGNNDLIQHPLNKYARELFFSPSYNSVFFNSINWANSLGKYKNQNNLINPLVSNVLMNIEVDDAISDQSLISHIVQMGAPIDGENSSEQFGYSVSCNTDGTIIAISSKLYDNERGCVRIYKWNNSSWNHIGTIDGEDQYNNSGSSVSLNADGTIVAIGAILNDGNGTYSGHVRVYDYVENRTPSEWKQIGADIDGEASMDYSGYSVSLSNDGKIVAIGAIYNDGNDNTNTQRGQVRVFEWTGSIWDQLGNDIDGDTANDNFGWSVSLSDNGTKLAISSIYSAGGTGHVRVYDYVKTRNPKWNQLGSDIDGNAGGEQFGYSVSLNSDGTIIAIGGQGHNSFTGVVRVFKYVNSEWEQLGSNIIGEAPDDHSGRSVSLSADGTILAIGALSNKGQARIYQYLEGVYASGWIQVGYDIDGEAAYNHLGSCVSLSKNGSVLHVAAPKYDNNTGRVYTYELLKQPITAMAVMGTPIDGDGGSFGGVSLNDDGTVLAIGAYSYSGGEVRVYKYLNPNNEIENYKDHKYFSVIPTGLAYPHDWAFYSFSLIQDSVTIVEFNPTQQNSVTFDDSVNLHNGTWGWQYAPSIYHNRTTPVFYVEIPSNYVFSNSNITAILVNYNTTHTPASGNFVSASSPNGPWHIRGNWSVSLPLPVASRNPVSSILDNGWMQMGDNINTGSSQSSGDHGRAMKLNADGTIVAIGAWQGSGNTGDVTIYKYDNINNIWNKIGDKIVGESGHDKSGYSVALSDDGTIVAIGAYDNDATDSNNSQRGHIRVYEWIGNSWNQIGNDVDGEIGYYNSRFGWSVSLSANGKILAGGAYYNDGGGKGSSTGHVRVYDYDETRNPEWKQLGDDIDGEAQSDESGQSISLNADGTIIAIGAPNNDGNDTTNTYRGQVRVYQYTNNTWLQMGSDIDGKFEYESSGKNISLSADGTILVIGAHGYDTPGTTNNKGHAYVYKYIKGLYASDWLLIDDKYGEEDQDQLGYSVSVSKNGSIFAVGAPGYDVDGANTGRVYTYELFEQPSIKSIIKMGEPFNGESANELFGYNVSSNVDGSIIAISSLYNDGTTNNTSDNRGSIRVYQYVKVNEEPIIYQSWKISDVTSNPITIATNGPWMPNKHVYVKVTPVNVGNKFRLRFQGGSGNYELKDIRIAKYIPGTQPDNLNQWYTISIDGTSGQTFVSIPAYGQKWTDWINAPIEANTPYLVYFKYHASKDYYSYWTTSTTNSWVNGSEENRVYNIDLMEVKYGNGWTQMGNDIYGEYSGGTLGNSVSLSNDGTIIGFGSHLANANGQYSGYASVHKYNDTTKIWDKMGDNIIGEGGDRYGWSTAISADGTIFAVSGKNHDNNKGVVRIYDYDENRVPAWEQLGLDIDGVAANDENGYSISLSSDGSIIAIGARLHDGIGTNSGYVRIYNYDKNRNPKWQQIGSNIDAIYQHDYFGHSVSLNVDGTIIAIGASYGNGINNSPDDCGYVSVYQNINNNWEQMGSTIYGKIVNEYFGHSVSLSNDGNILAIGGYYNTDKVGAGYIGVVRVYKYVSGLYSNDWVQIGNTIYGNEASGYFGWSVSLSKNGSILLVGAPYTDSNGTDSGRAYTYEIVDTSNIVETNISSTQSTPTESFSVTFDGDVLGTVDSNTVLYQPKGQVWETNGIGPYRYNKFLLDVHIPGNYVASTWVGATLSDGNIVETVITTRMRIWMIIIEGQESQVDLVGWNLVNNYKYFLFRDTANTQYKYPSITPIYNRIFEAGTTYLDNSIALFVFENIDDTVV